MKLSFLELNIRVVKPALYLLNDSSNFRLKAALHLLQIIGLEIGYEKVYQPCPDVSIYAIRLIVYRIKFLKQSNQK